MTKIAESIDEIFDDIWHQRRMAEAEKRKPVDPLTHYCRYSKAYWRYADDVLNRYVRGTTDPMRLAQAKVLLSDRYLEVRAYAPKGHRDKLSDKGHVCLYQVWITSMHEVMATQLALDPPRVLKIVAPKQESKPSSDTYAEMKPMIYLGPWTE